MTRIMIESKKEDKDGICSLFMYTMFPSSDYAIQHEIKKMTADLHLLYTELKEEQSNFRELKVTLDKLNNKRVAMDPNGMSRPEAIKSTRARMITVKNKIDAIKRQIDFYEKSKYAMESTKMTTDANARIGQLAKRMNRVRSIDPDITIKNMEDIADTNEEIEKISNKVNDAMVAGWSCDLDADEAMLDEYLETYDDDDMAVMDEEVVDNTDEDVFIEERVKVPTHTAPKLETLPERKAVMEYF